MAEPAAKKARVGEEDAEDTTDMARDYLRFRLVESHEPEQLAKEIDAGGKEFQLDFFHQVFGIAEKIRGYTDLSVDIWFSARTYHAWVDVRYTHK
jgi:hypothetical protein